MTVRRPPPPEVSRDPLAPVLRDVRAVVFDTDVITDSARGHTAAWKTAFHASLRAHPPEEPGLRRPFAARDDCLRYVDAKSRLDGAASFLAARAVGASEKTVRAVAAEKERLFTGRLHAQGVDAYSGTVRLVRALRRTGIPVAAASAASASRHAGALLAGAGVSYRFDAPVDGGEAARPGLAGKPRPDLFLEAARRLGVPADLAGVEAGLSGGFALVVGVDRAAGPGTAARRLRHGADIVVRDLEELLAGRAPR
ncbi:HAD family hydrolase [Streptomyces canus]|uniref:HAD family hydrolase n=1 Tax=Streptomyces canus TaxID=58343 RepID=UPI0036F0095A